MEEERISAVDALEQTVVLLSGLQIPIAMIDQIGTPIATAIQTILAVIQAAKEPETEKEGDQNGL